MNKKTSIALFAVAVFVALVFALMATRLSSTTYAESSLSAVPSSSIGPNARVPIGSGSSVTSLRGTVDRAEPAAKDVPLSSAMLQANNLRVFVEASKRRPTEGGYFYAVEAMSMCRQKMNLLPSRSSGTPSDLPRDLARQKLVALCGDFTQAEFSDSYFVLRKQGKDLRDPLISARDALLDSVNESQSSRRAALSSVIASKDPYFVSTVWPYLRDYQEDKSTDSSRSYYFEGVGFDGDGYQLYEAAWALVPCVVGATCDSGSDAGLLSACIEQGLCVNSREELFKRTIAHGVDYQQARALAERLVAAVRSGNSAAFFAP